MGVIRVSQSQACRLPSDSISIGLEFPMNTGNIDSSMEMTFHSTAVARKKKGGARKKKPKPHSFRYTRKEILSDNG